MDAKSVKRFVRKIVIVVDLSKGDKYDFKLPLVFL